MPERARRNRHAPAASSAAAPAPLPFCMPSLGADMDAGTILEWLVAPGAEVHKGDAMAVVETDKSDLEVEVFHDAVVTDLVVPVGQKVPVGTVIALLAPPGSAVPAAPPRDDAPATATRERRAAPAVPSPAPEPALAPEHRASDTGDVHSPMLRHLAATLHVDTNQLHGTGTGGRITRDDIERAAAARRITPRARRLARAHGVDIDTIAERGVVTGERVLAMAGSASAPRTAAAPRGAGRDSMRQAIARVMTASWQQIPHYRVELRIDVHAAMTALAERNLARAAAERVLPAAVLARATALAASTVQGVNGHWAEDGFRPGEGVHLGVVVALRNGGLLAPVIRDADHKTLEEIMDELRDLVTRARSGRLRASEVTGATLTVTDLGEGGADSVAPIIHPPQVAIVGFGAVHLEPCVLGGDVVPRLVVHTSLAGDHRAVDGRIGSLFLTTLATILQEVPTDEHRS